MKFEIDDATVEHILALTPANMDWHDHGAVISLGEAVLHMAGTWTVYVFKVGSGPKKIGMTVGPLMKRLGSLQTGNPEEITVLDAISVNREMTPIIERYVHDRLAAKRIRGEWFDCTDGEAVETLEEAYSVFLGHWWRWFCDNVGIYPGIFAPHRPGRVVRVSAEGRTLDVEWAVAVD